ncbi:hypothetical protein HF086_006321 [Spodoptera exigua]|uniref:Macro domain-containing protein n=1 Tax=Spodoptera exigua TaxID=7107 RepID=A0A922MN93_SPOEX|nr:hypothetical protein HF086_006321 [Spodoptera exigua]
MRAPAGGGVSCAGVPRWSHSAPAHQADYDNTPAHTHPVFLHDDHINSRFAIWQGDISSLEVDAITNTTDETLTECNAINERILQVAGPELKEEIITRGYECRTGEVVVTPGFGLRCRHIIHTVSPKYVPKYHTAAETSLHNCYRHDPSSPGESPRAVAGGAVVVVRAGRGAVERAGAAVLPAVGARGRRRALASAARRANARPTHPHHTQPALA